MRRLQPLLFLLAIALLPGVGPARAAADDSGTLTVQARGLKSTEGELRFVIFDSKKAFLKRPIRAEVLKIDGEEVTWKIDSLPHGTYAVLVHHDLDASGEMERHWYGKPKEPTGTSNDPPARMGPPLWKKASFQFAAPALTIVITVS